MGCVLRAHTFFHLQLAGHTRPLCSFAARLTTEDNDIVITFLVPPNVYENCVLEFAFQPSDVRDRIRLVPVFH